MKLDESTLTALRDEGPFLTVWAHPHRGYGYIKELVIMADDESKGLRPLAVAQRFGGRHVGPRHREEIDASGDCTEVVADLTEVLRILDLLEVARLPLAPSQRNAKFFGGSHYGLRVEWGAFETEHRWYGSVESTEAPVAALWRSIDNLVPDP